VAERFQVLLPNKKCGKNVFVQPFYMKGDRTRHTAGKGTESPNQIRRITPNGALPKIHRIWIHMLARLNAPNALGKKKRLRQLYT
jgi:hypothetical protein